MMPSGDKKVKTKSLSVQKAINTKMRVQWGSVLFPSKKEKIQIRSVDVSSISTPRNSAGEALRLQKQQEKPPHTLILYWSPLDSFDDVLGINKSEHQYNSIHSHCNVQLQKSVTHNDFEAKFLWCVNQRAPQSLLVCRHKCCRVPWPPWKQLKPQSYKTSGVQNVWTLHSLCFEQQGHPRAWL